MNSAPAVLLEPAVLAQSAPCLSPLMVQKETYPWATQTPEPSPRFWNAMPTMTGPPQSAMPQPSQLSFEQLRNICEPFFERMCCTLDVQTMCFADGMTAAHR